MCKCARMLEWMCLMCVCVTGLCRIIIRHRHAGAGAELWWDEVKQEKWRVDESCREN